MPRITRRKAKEMDPHVHCIFTYEASVLHPPSTDYRNLTIKLPLVNMCAKTTCVEHNNVHVFWGEYTYVEINGVPYDPKPGRDQDYLNALTSLDSIEFFQVPYIIHAVQNMIGTKIFNSYKRKKNISIRSLVNLFDHLELSRS